MPGGRPRWTRARSTPGRVNCSRWEQGSHRRMPRRWTFPTRKSHPTRWLSATPCVTRLRRVSSGRSSICSSRGTALIASCSIKVNSRSGINFSGGVASLWYLLRFPLQTPARRRELLRGESWVLPVLGAMSDSDHSRLGYSCSFLCTARSRSSRNDLNVETAADQSARGESRPVFLVPSLCHADKKTFSTIR